MKYNIFFFKIPFYICAVNVKIIDVVEQILNIVVQIIYFAKPMHANKHCRRTYDLGNQRSVRLSSVQPCSRQRWGQDPGKTVENFPYLLLIFGLFYFVQILGIFFCFSVDMYCFECAHMGKKSPNAYKYTSLWILIFLNNWETVKQLLSLFLMISCFILPVILRRRQEWRGRWHDRKLSSSSVFSSLWQRWLLSCTLLH